MSSRNDGGPAFPSGVAIEPGPHVPAGMSLRDWFAGQALAGFLAAGRSDHGGYGEICDADVAADYAYNQADCMLIRRDAMPTYSQDRKDQKELAQPHGSDG
jgi:hypothetical protein